MEENPGTKVAGGKKKERKKERKKEKKKERKKKQKTEKFKVSLFNSNRSKKTKIPWKVRLVLMERGERKHGYETIWISRQRKERIRRKMKRYGG